MHHLIAPPVYPSHILFAGGCLIVSDYVSQLEEEEALEWPQAGTTAPPDAAAPAMATTYNYGAQYAFAANDNSYGRQGAPNNV